MKTRLNRLRHFSTGQLVLAGVAVFLAWLVFSRSFTAFFAAAAPQSALWIDSGQPVALLNLADQAINNRSRQQNKLPPDAATRNADNAGNGAGHDEGTKNLSRAFSQFEPVGRNKSVNRPRPPENEAAVRRWLVTSVANEPLNARGLRMLGQVAEADGNDAEASKFMYAASGLSLHETAATFWLLRTSIAAGDYKQAVNYADTLLRSDPESYVFVVPFLAQIGEDKAGAGFVEAVLATDPPWRDRFITTLPYSVTDARTPLHFLLAMRSGAKPPTIDDLGPYVDLLIKHKLYSLAYYTWLQFLPADELRHAGLLFNGSFEVAPSGLPFDWTITQGVGVTVDIVPRRDRSNGHALLVNFQFGRVDYHSVTEMVMLAPGTYQFGGEYKGELVGPRGMVWRVLCANGKLVGGTESPAINGVTKDWRSMSFAFTVPPNDCPAQIVSLDLDARMASEQLVSGSVLFSDLRITRRADVPVPSAGPKK
jgi:hypothetical protein